MEEKKTNGPINKEVTNNKPKKRLIFLKVLLIIVAVIIFIVGSMKLCTLWAEKDINKIATVFPFEFAEGDSMNYVTSDFNLSKTIVVGNKKYKVKWKSNSKNVKIKKDGSVTVDTTDIKAKNVTLTVVHRRFLGKAEYKYNINIVSDIKHYEVDDVKVITIDSLRDQTYQYKMEAQVQPDGVVKYMYGDFDGTRVYSKEDAYVIAEAYRNNLGIDENVTFEYEKMNGSKDYISYVFRGLYNGIKLSDSVIVITVDSISFELVKITNLITKTMPTSLEINDDIDCVSILEEYMINKKGEKEIIILEDERMYYEGIICNKYYVLVEDDSSYTAVVSCVDGSIMYCDQDVTYAKYVDAKCKGKDEWDNTLEFTACTNGKKYYLGDETRDIIVYENLGLWYSYQELIEKNGGKVPSNKEAILQLFTLASYLAQKGYNKSIGSDSNEFDNPVGVEALSGIQNAWIYFAENFNHYSYDRNNAPIRIYVYTNKGYNEDNASWLQDSKTIEVYPADKYEHTLACSPDVLAHEYTHAIFYSFIPEQHIINNMNNEIKGINEGYADVFSQLIVGNKEWKFGKNELYDPATETNQIVYMRDIANYNSDDAMTICSEKYHDEIWEWKDGEPHVISVLISHVAYEMHASGLFTDEDIAKIFYRSMEIGIFDVDTTMVDVRRNLIHAAEELQYSKELQDFIAHRFDLEEIFDPDYEIETEKYKLVEIVTNTYSEDEIIKSKPNYVDGDPILEGDELSHYIVFYSIPQIVLGDGTMYIWEYNTNKWKDSDEEIEKRIEALINTDSNVLEMVNNVSDVANLFVDVSNIVSESEGNGPVDIEVNNKIDVTYKRIGKMKYKIASKLLTAGEMNIREYMSDALGEEETGIAGLLKMYLYTFYSIKSTPYKLYTNL